MIFILFYLQLYLFIALCYSKYIVEASKKEEKNKNINIKMKEENFLMTINSTMIFILSKDIKLKVESVFLALMLITIMATLFQIFWLCFKESKKKEKI